MNAQEDRCGLHVVKLTAANIPGASVSEPFKAHATPALRWWLLCRGIAAPQSSKVAELCNRRIYISSYLSFELSSPWNGTSYEEKQNAYLTSKKDI